MIRGVAAALLAVAALALGTALRAEPSPTPTVSHGRIEVLTGLSPTAETARQAWVWLPDGYPAQQPYAVLYMHDGQMLFDAAVTWNRQEWQVDEVAHRLIERGAVRPFIVVAVANAGAARSAEYLPQKPFERLTDAQRERLRVARRGEQAFLSEPVRSDRYLDFLVSTLKPEIDRRYATDPSRAATAVMGSSMGGLVSLYALIEHPDVFGHAACLSTHWPGSFLLDDTALPEALLGYLEQHLPPAGDHRLYFDHGTATLDAHYGRWQGRVDAIVRAKGYRDADWQTRVFDGAEHTERAWAARLDQPLVFLFGRDPPDRDRQGAGSR